MSPNLILIVADDLDVPVGRVLAVVVAVDRAVEEPGAGRAERGGAVPVVEVEVEDSDRPDQTRRTQRLGCHDEAVEGAEALAVVGVREGAEDDYSLVRDAWSQRRDYQIFGDRPNDGRDLPDRPDLMASLVAADGAIVNATTTGVQTSPSIAAIEDGGYVVVWDDREQFIRGQRYDAFGNRVGGEFTPFAQAGDLDLTGPEVIGLAGGGWAVLWEDRNFGIRIAIYMRNGNTLEAPFEVTGAGRGSFGSMDMVQRQNGDLVVVRKQTTARNGQTVVALVNNEATIKKYYRKDGRIELQVGTNRVGNSKGVGIKDSDIVRPSVQRRHVSQANRKRPARWIEERGLVEIGGRRRSAPS